MLEISEPARRLIGDAWRRGRVLVLGAPWTDYRWHGAVTATWRRMTDDLLADHVRIGDGEGTGMLLRSDLVGEVTRRHFRLEEHSIVGLWRGIVVRELGPAPAPIQIDDGLWPRVRTRR